MFGLWGKERLTGGDPYKLEERFAGTRLSRDLDANERMLRELFAGDDTMIFRRFGRGRDFLLLMVDGMINETTVDRNIVWAIEQAERSGEPTGLGDLTDAVLPANDIKRTGKLSEMLDCLLYGDTLLLRRGAREALVISTKGFDRRSVPESENEKGSRGPQEAFAEAFMINLSLIRRKLRTPDLKFSFRTMGDVSRTTVVLCYLRGVAEEGLVRETERRLDRVTLHGVLDSNYLAETISDRAGHFFRTVGNTERPDVVAAKLLEGRVAILVDGSPNALTVPHVFMEYFQSQNDYYSGHWIGSFSRLLRWLAFLITVSAPALYAAVLNFHPEMLPATMLITISQARSGILIPTVAELAFMLVTLCILQEAGVRAPPEIGASLSIVGGLILGQAAVDAKLVSAPVIIVVAVWAVTGMMLPNLRSPTLACTALLLALAGALGLYGYAVGVTLIVLGMADIRSFGVPYLAYAMPYSFRELRDSFLRTDWRRLDASPVFSGEEEP